MFSCLQEENRLLQTLAAIIHICDVTFDPNDEGCRLSNPSLTAVIADFLQIDSEELAQCLVQEAMITRGTVVGQYRHEYRTTVYIVHILL